MVKVEDSKAKVKADRLEEIAKDFLKFNRPLITRIGDGSLAIHVEKKITPEIIVWIRDNKIEVRSEAYLEKTVGLARAYEEVLPDLEFTVVKNY